MALSTAGRLILSKVAGLVTKGSRTAAKEVTRNAAKPSRVVSAATTPTRSPIVRAAAVTPSTTRAAATTSPIPRLTQADVRRGAVTPEELAQDRAYRKAIADLRKISKPAPAKKAPVKKAAAKKAQPSPYMDDADIARDGIVDVTKAAPKAPSRAAAAGGGGKKPPTPRGKRAAETPEPTPRVSTGDRRFPTRGALETVGVLAPLAVTEDTPAPLRFAAAALSAGAGLSGAARALGRRGFLSQATRQAFGQATPLARAGMAATRGVIPAATAAAGFEMAQRALGTGRGPAVPVAEALTADTPETQVLAPEVIFPEAPSVDMGGVSPEQQYLDEVQAAIDLLTQEADNQAAADTAAVESSADAALQQLIDAYQGLGNVQAAASAGDPILLQQLAAIDADYQAGLAQIQNNYGAAISQIQGYQDQASQLLGNVAAAQQTAFEQAAGGLEAGGIPTGLTGGEAAMSGVSDTALGGAGITGAALSRGFAGAAQAGALADQLRVGTELGAELAAARMGQADLQAALGRDYLGAKADARTDAAEREAAARAEREQLAREGILTAAQLRYERELDKEAQAARAAEAKADRRQRISEIEADTRLAMADMVARMTPEELAQWRGSAAGSRRFTAPSWFGRYIEKPDNTPVKIELSPDTPATVGSVNSFLDVLYAHMNTPGARNPATALQSWSEFFDTLSPDGKRILAARNIPTTGGQMYKELFKSTPSK